MASSSTTSAAAAALLQRQLKQMHSDKDIPGISVGLVGSNIFEWEVMLMISDDCKYYGGMNELINTSTLSLITTRAPPPSTSLQPLYLVTRSIF